MSYDIFLSYRRKNADGHSNVGTVRTFMYVFERHGYEVFFDFKDCTDEYFSDTILPSIRTCQYFVLVLTRGCLERCKDKGDWLRREIEEAIKHGRKIIPITPDGEFEVWPTDIPDSMKALSANDGLQITTIHTDSIFEDNMAQLIRNRMNPPQRRRVDGMENYPNLKVKSNLDCIMFVDEEERANISANTLEKIPLKAGEYMLRFESVENAADYVEDDEFNMPDKDKLYKVDLLTLKQEREMKEREEKERQEQERLEKEKREREEKERLEQERLEKEKREREKREREERERLEREQREKEEKERKEREARGEFEVKGVKFKMVKVEGGTFTMGATAEQGSDTDSDEKPAHQVTLRGYYIGESVVTQALWKAVMGNNPSTWKGDNLPVETVSWEEAQEFIKKLNQETGRIFRLPTEAEWEYAARGGKNSKGYKYSGSNSIDEVAWYVGNSGGKTHPVKEKKANELDLYDMSGNVWEWCNDCYGEYSSDVQTNPQGPEKGSCRVLRGGSCSCDPRGCRVSYRHYFTPMRRINFVGFRLVLCP